MTSYARGLPLVANNLWRLWLLCWSLALILASCGSGSDEPEAPDVAGAVAPALRVVGLVPSLNELVIALGAGEQLAAKTDFDTHSRADELPSIGGGLDPSLEQIVALDIDVVLMSAGRDTPALAERLRELSVQVLELPTQSISDVHGSIARLGELFDMEAEAESLSASVSADLDEIRTRVSELPPVPVMYVVWSDPPMTTGGGTFIDEVIQIAGGRNVFDDSVMGWPTVGFESIVARRPAVVIWPQGEITIDNVDVLKTTPGWRDVEAVQDGRIVLVDGNLFNRPGPSVVVAARRLAEALHPEAF